MKDPRTHLDALIEVLAAHRVDFIVVEGVCGALQGAPISTIDLDVVHSRKPENLARLLAALADLDAVFRESLPKKIAPTASHLAPLGHQLLITRLGPLDLLGTIGKGRGYDDLIGSCDRMVVGSRTYQVLKLATLIETKEEAGRAKDLAVLPILRRTLEEKRRK